jgi:hypothetical protein
MRARLLVSLSALLVIATVAVPVAHARGGDHCAFRLRAIGRKASVTLAEPVLIGCYPTLAEALAAGSGGGIRVDASSPADLTDASVRSSILTSDVLIGTEFNQTGFGGTSQDYFAPSTCSQTNTWEVNYVGDTWNDKFSSGKGFGGCDHNKKFAAADFGGDVLTCTPNCNDYGSLSNAVSSLRWRP